jgi:tetratricopeptide (TPR) repeat protein
MLLRDALPWRADTVYLRLGIVENERGRVEPARAYWALTPQALPYLLAQGDLRSGLGQASQASAYFAHAAALAPQSSSALYRVGQLTAAQGDASAALLRLQQAIDMDNFDGGASEKANAYAALGSVLRSQQRWGEAVQAYQQAQALASPFIWQRDLVHSMYRRDGNSVAAEAYARASIIQSPNLVEPYMGLIEVLDAEGRVDEALDVGWTAVNRFPDASAPMLYMGQVYMERGEYDKAEDLFERVVILRPRNAQLRMWLVRLALQRQQPELALAELRKGLSLMPNEATFYVAIGDIERAAGNTGAARTAYRSALAIDAQNAAAQRGLSALPD